MLSLELPPVFADLQIPLLYLTNIITLAVGPQRHTIRLLLSLPTVVLLVSQSLYRDWPGTWGNHYAVNCLVCSAVTVYVDWVLLSSPDKEGWRKIRYGEGKEEGEMNGKARGTTKSVANGTAKKGENNAVPQHFWPRLWWGVRLATTNRYVGWSCQVKNVHMEVESDYPRLYILSLSFISYCFANSHP